MASLNVLTFDAESRPVDFEVWLDDLQLFLQCDSKDGLSLFDLTSGASTAPAADADSTVRSQWLTREAAARLAVRNHLPSTERAHFSQYKSARALYDAVVAHYSSPTTAALSRLMLPYLFPDLAAFATVADLVAHLRTSHARYRAALPTEDHFLSLCPTALTVDLLEERLAAVEKSILAVGASRGDRRTPFFEGCSPVPLLPSVASAAAFDLVGTEEVGADSLTVRTWSLIPFLVDFAVACRLDYAASLVAESASVCPPSVGGECALGTDVPEDRQEDLECFAAASPHLVSMLLTPEGDPDALDIPTPRSYAEAIEGPYSSQWQAAMDAETTSWKSTGTYVDEVPPPGANIVSGMWIFRVKRPPGSPPAFKARYVARGFSQRQGVDFFQTFSPTPKMTTLRVLLHVAAQRDYELHSLDFSTAFLQGSLHEEIWLRRPRGFTGSFPAGTQWSLRRPVYGLRQAPREWHDTLRTTLAALGFAPSTVDPSLFLRTDATLPPFYVLVYVDDLVFATADTEALAHVKSELQKRHTCTDLVG
ncbi:unnamed protein product [Closterium sp. NIES-53]